MSSPPKPSAPWVIPPPKKNLVVGVGEMIVSNDTGAELVTYSLGSCLGVTAYDPAAHIGGLLHVMLPDSTIDPEKARTHPCMFVDTGVAQLLRALGGLGVMPRRLYIKVAGGAQFLDERRLFNIGERNFRALVNELWKHGLAVQSRAVGGRSSRTLRFGVSAGQVTIHSPGEPVVSL